MQPSHAASLTFLLDCVRKVRFVVRIVPTVPKLSFSQCYLARRDLALYFLRVRRLCCSLCMRCRHLTTGSNPVFLVPRVTAVPDVLRRRSTADFYVRRLISTGDIVVLVLFHTFTEQLLLVLKARSGESFTSSYPGGTTMKLPFGKTKDTRPDHGPDSQGW